MAGGRRISRVISSSSNNKHNSFVYPSSSPGGTSVTEERLAPVLDMKHIKMPYLPRESTLTFEIILLLHIGVFTSLQFLHLYRTVWWLPQSFNSSGMNFHLIDGNIVVFILALLARRIPYLILKSFMPSFSHWILQIVLTAQMLTWILLTTFHLWNELLLSTFHIIYLFGPFVFYFQIYGLNIYTLWELEEIDNPNFEGCCPGNCQSHSYHHVCTNDPMEIRDEVELLRKEFNCRMSRILCQTTFLAYYSCFLPWCFVQKYVHYDLWWVSQHLILCWMIIFSLLVSRAFCPDFSDGLHKVACHLGKWTRLRPTHIPSNAWMSEYLFSPGAIVKHQRELYKAEGFFSVASEPGNCTHTRFQLLFCGSSFPRLLLGFHVSLLILCLLILIRTNEWYQVISISALLVTSLYTFIRLGRDFLVAWKMYQAEEMIIKQQQQQ